MPRKKSPPPLPDPDTLPPGTPVAIYARASPGMTQEKSVPDQLREARQYVEERGWNPAVVLADDDVSGTDPGREKLNELLALLEKRPVPIRAVVVWSYSRLAREMGMGYVLLGHTRMAGVVIASISDPSSVGARDIEEPIKLYSAAKESERISRDTARGMADMIRQGYAPGGFPPRGYTVEYDVVGVRKNGRPRRWPRWVKDPEWEEQVAAAWRMRLEGASYKTILSETGVYKSANSLSTFFRNPAYCGFPWWYLNHTEEDVSECVGHDPIVNPYLSISEFLLAQGRDAEHPRRKGSGWALSGMITCGYCGAAAVVMPYSHSRHCDLCKARWPTATAECPECGADYSHRGGFHRYLCGTHKRHKERCPDSRYVAGRKLELGILHELAPHFTGERMGEMLDGVNEALQVAHQARNREREEVLEELETIEDAIGNLLDLAEQGKGGEAILSRLEARQRDQIQLKTKLATMPDPGRPPYVSHQRIDALTSLFRERVFDLRRQELRRVFRGLGTSVILWRDTAEASVEWPPLRMLLDVGTGIVLPQRHAQSAALEMSPAGGTLKAARLRVAVAV